MAKKQSNAILLVDDNPGFLEILSVKLQSAGHEVVIANGAEEGVKKAKELLPKLILMDMQMPKMSGADALLKMKEEKDLKDTTVVFLTSFGDEQLLEQEKMLYSQMGAADYLKKTDDLDELLKKVQTYLP